MSNAVLKMDGAFHNVVYKTDDLNIFKLSKFNRNVILRQEMIKQAEEGFIAPLIVNEDMVVIDGQHRLKASEKVEVPVEYIVKPGLGKEDIVRMNTVQKPWNLANYIESYANEGRGEYVKLLNLINQKYTNVSLTTQIAINDPASPARVKDMVKEGKFKFFDYTKALEFLEYFQYFCEKTKTPKRSSLTSALYELFRVEKFDRNRIINKVLETGFDEDIKVKTHRHTDMLKNLIDAYNKQLRSSLDNAIEYHITSHGTLIVDEDKHEWTKENRSEATDQ